jgi:hypothetical protein
MSAIVRESFTDVEIPYEASRLEELPPLELKRAPMMAV